MKIKIKKFLIRLFEEELLSVLAVFISLGLIIFAYADGAILSITFIPEGGTITVTAPNGGESWKINSTHNITWDSSGVTNVKIELQRSGGGSWETITNSTASDGSYPWLVTSPATSQAKIKITNVDDETVYDESNNVFSIASSGGGGGYYFPIALPQISSVTPLTIYNSEEATLLITGTNLDSIRRVLLGGRDLGNVQVIDSGQVKATVPLGFPPGPCSLMLIDSSYSSSVYDKSLTVYRADYQAEVLEQSEKKLRLAVNEKAKLWATLKNTSNTAWSTRGEFPLHLGTVKKKDRPSLFYEAGSWLSLNRVQALAEDPPVVYPGGVVRFTFEVVAPGKPGTYVEVFQPVLEGKGWLKSPPLVWEITVVPSPGEEILPPTAGEGGYYAARWIRQSPYPILAPGERATLWVEFENTGTLPWYSDGNGEPAVRLGTDRPRDRLSIFRNGNWLNHNRVATLSRKVVMPGETGRFNFEIVAPLNGHTTYREYFRPVAEFKEWISPDWGVYWDITVKRNFRRKNVFSVWTKPKPAIVPPSTGGESSPNSPASLSKKLSWATKVLSQLTELFKGLWRW